MCRELKLRLQAQSVSRSMDPGDGRPGPGSSAALCDFGKSFTLSGTVGTLIPVAPSFPVLRMRWAHVFQGSQRAAPTAITSYLLLITVAV